MDSSYIFTAAASVILTYLLLKIFQTYFLKNNILDNFNHRSSHKVIATRSGGVSIIASIFIISCSYYIFNQTIYDYSLLIPILLLGLIGIYDDIYTLDFKLKFIFQIIAAKIIIDSGLIVDNFHGILGIYEINRTVAQVITILIICSIINSINFIDGLDGLAGTVIIVFLSFFELFSKYTSELLGLTIIVISALFSFLYFNFKKNNKIFLGDSGSLFFGGLVSIYVLTILSNNYYIDNQFDINKILFVISILSYPIVDFTRIIFTRILAGKSPFIADNNHIHHILNRRLKSHVKVLIVIFSFQIMIFTILQLIF